MVDNTSTRVQSHVLLPLNCLCITVDLMQRLSIRKNVIRFYIDDKISHGGKISELGQQASNVQAFLKNVPVTLLSSCGEFLTVPLTAIEHPSSVKELYDNTESESLLM